MGAAVRVSTTAAVIVACALPSAAANVLPRAVALWKGTAVGSGEVAIVATLIMAALIMAACPFAVKRARNPIEKLVFLAVGLGLATFNFAMAHDTIGKLRDLGAAPVRQLHSQSAALKSRIEGAASAASKVPQHPPTSPEMVTAAQDAVASAEVARAQECGKVGDNCRQRVLEKAAAVADLAKVQANRAQTIRLEKAEAEQSGAQKELDAIGYVPEKADKSASRLAKDLAHWVDLGPDPDETLIDWLIKVTAGVVELVALVGPRMILLAIFGDVPQEPRRWQWPSWRRRRHIEPDASAKPEIVDTAPAAPAAAVEIAAPKRTAAPRGKASKSKAAAVGDADSVRQWFKSRTVARASSKLKPKETYDGSYLPWCEEQRIEPVSFTVFGTIIKAPVAEGGCGVGFERNRSKRDFYVGIALVSAPKLVATGSTGIAAGARGLVHPLNHGPAT